MVLARLNLQLSELSQFVTPEPYPAKTNGKIMSNPNAGHAAWFVLEEVAPEVYTTRGMSTMLKGATVSTINTTRNVTASAANATASAANTLISPLMQGLSGENEPDALGGSSTGKDSTGKGTPSGASGSGPSSSSARAKNSYLSMLSSDQPRENVAAPQLKIRIRIVEEKE